MHLRFMEFAAKRYATEHLRRRAQPLSESEDERETLEYAESEEKEHDETECDLDDNERNGIYDLAETLSEKRERVGIPWQS